MSRKVTVEANVVAIFEVPVKIELLIRSDEGADVDGMVSQFIKNGRESFPKGDIENITVMDASESAAQAFEMEHENDSIQDLIKKKALKMRLINATVTDSH